MDLIGQLTQQLGLAPDTAQAASGSLFSLIQQHAPAGAFQQLLGAAPEVAGWMSRAQGAGAVPPASSGGLGALGGGSSGGLSGMLGAAAGSMLGGAGGGAATQMAALTGMLGRFGVSPEMAMKVLPLALQFVQSKLGPQGTQQLVSGMPLLQQLLQGGGAQGQGGGLGGMLGKLF
ncbi:hypothetical protein FGE12_28015 [Aggregicoccus sp. 17bor-14]|uniref:DUF2780 domain-containing protein n=1 Tax=Myxococcaceae TaxID=31 RepID=UPI00129D05BD|nr:MULTISPECIES: DUF2780 domain-containing protein [Myxococcaceae]MBF5046295.1 DUF2780 domain-containing protein [Simulacricoccus sp. 17bor-14]MRI92017.1 hypothetical protein [Aggregicoccus sp. 17bor-14]